MTSVAPPCTALNCTNSVPESSRNVHHSISSWSRSQGASVGARRWGNPESHAALTAGLTGSIVTSRRTPLRSDNRERCRACLVDHAKPGEQLADPQVERAERQQVRGIVAGHQWLDEREHIIDRYPADGFHASAHEVLIWRASGSDHEALGKAPRAEGIEVGAVARPERPDAAVAVAPVPGRHRGEAKQLDQPLVVGERFGPSSDLVGGRDPGAAIHPEPAIGVDRVPRLQHRLDIGPESAGGRRVWRRRRALRRRGGRCGRAAGCPDHRHDREDDAANW